jgi:hypothetical protein
MPSFKSPKTHAHFEGVFDETYKDLLKYSKQTPELVKRAKTQIFTYYQGVDRKFVITFMTPSGTTPGLYWIQKIELADMKAIIKKYGKIKKPLELVRLAMAGRVKTSCNDPDGNDEPSWLYWGHKYKADISGYNYGTGEKRFPEIRNPQLKGGGCKHVRAVMEALPFHAGKITQDLKKLKVFPK